jgi:ABC-type transporter Mla maintaining outer membrane lipid asymmetry ATPase subunit MlaF
MSEPQNLSTAAAQPLIELRDAIVATMQDASFVVLEKVNWRVMPGDFWVVGGPQRSGKSDLMLLAAAVLPPANGSCKLFGMETRSFSEADLGKRLRVGFVGESGQLFNRLTVAENVALPLCYHKNLTPAGAAAEVKAVLDLVELSPLADVTPANVPANWRRRAVLARALIMKPDLLLLDNPLGGLASRHLFWWLRFLNQLWHGHEFFGGRPMTVVATTDDFRPWRDLPRQFAILRDKKFVPLGTWRQVETADDPMVKELLSLHPEPTT